MQIIAHRGHHAVEPENSLEAFASALPFQPDAMELDCRLSKDGVPVVFHDEQVPFFGALRPVDSLDAAELQSVDLGRGRRIPLLETVMEAFAGRIPLVLDVKSSGMLPVLAPWLDRAAHYKGLHLTSGLEEDLPAFMRAYPEITCSLILHRRVFGVAALCRRMRLRAVSVNREWAGEALVRELRAEGVSARVYTVNDPEEALKLREWGVEALYTDNLPALMALRGGGPRP